MSRDRKSMTPRTAQNLSYLLNQFAEESRIDPLRDL